ncbi:MAG: glutamate-5-semialdehyde dehydrogenase [Pseudomonadota bacterium]
MDATGDMMTEMGARARRAAAAMREASTAQKNAALLKASALIKESEADILAANAAEIEAAKNDGRSGAFIDRMTLNAERIDGICAALQTIASLDDPVGKIIAETRRPNGLAISRIRTPIGVIAVIYESRPNVTVDAAAIALKAGNAVILRGGSECIATNRALHQCMRAACHAAGLPEDAAQFVDTPDRAAVGALLSGLDGAIDLVIPRGGKSLVARVQSDARAPVLSHLDGVCHVYIDGAADPEKAVAIALNSKMRRPGVCGAAETLLIDMAARELYAPVAAALRDAGCEIRDDGTIREWDPDAAPASDEDFYTEYLAPVISVAGVDGVEGAITHIAKYSSGHTEAIVTEDAAAASEFLARIDSAIVLHNASTQFADGGEFGLGAEIGIATGRLHARGPVGVEELTTYKNVVRGDGQIRP